MKAVKSYKFWFCTGSQDLYGDECLKKVAKHSRIIVEELNKSGILPFEVIWKPTLITNELIRKTLRGRYHMDAYVLPGEVLDSGTAGVQKTSASSAHTVQ